MKNTIKVVRCIAIIALVAVIGFSMTACDKSPSTIKTIPGLKTTNPPAGAMANAGIDQAVLNALYAGAGQRSNFGSSEYQGYVLDEDEYYGKLILYFQNRTNKSYNETIKALADNLNVDYWEGIGEEYYQNYFNYVYEGDKPNNISMCFGDYNEVNNFNFIMLFKDKFNIDGGSIPANVLSVSFLWFVE